MSDGTNTISKLCPDDDRQAGATAAGRALAEAAARRVQIEAQIAAMPREIGGRRGNEPVRYGDWEIKGLASDF